MHLRLLDTRVQTFSHNATIKLSHVYSKGVIQALNRDSLCSSAVVLTRRSTSVARLVVENTALESAGLELGSNACYIEAMWSERVNLSDPQFHHLKYQNCNSVN